VGSTREAYVAKSKTNRPHEELLITTNVAQLETVLISIDTTTLYDGIHRTSKSRAVTKHNSKQKRSTTEGRTKEKDQRSARKRLYRPTHATRTYEYR